MPKMKTIETILLAISTIIAAASSIIKFIKHIGRAKQT